MDQSLKSKVDQACRTADAFTKLYYETIDKRRHLIMKLYMETGLLVWNGNGIEGNERIQKFYIDLPASDHTIQTLDSQPISDTAVNGQLTFLIQVSGVVRFQKKQPKTFQQTFIVTAQADKWKIVSDCLRLQDGID